MRKLFQVMDPAATVASLLLLGVLGWKIALLSLHPSPLQAHRLLAAADSVRADSGRLVLVVNAAERADADRAAERIRRAHPRRPLAVHPVSWTPSADGKASNSGVAALVRSYGHTRLPVLLTLSRDAQVVRVQSLARGAE
jgi:hypothetical protein